MNLHNWPSIAAAYGLGLLTGAQPSGERFSTLAGAVIMLAGLLPLLYQVAQIIKERK